MPVATAPYSEVHAALVKARADLSVARSKGQGTLYIEDRIRVLERRCRAL
jgi:hypothetical protein